MAQERKIDETQGKYLRASESGQDLTGAEWQPCRVLVTTERLVLRGEESLEVPLDDVEEVGDRYDCNQATRAEPDYLTLFVDEAVLLVTAPEFDALETNFFRAMLDGAIISVRHPAVEGGVVQDVEWQRGRTKITEEAVRLVTEDGAKVAIDRADIGEMATDATVVDGEERAVVEVEHTEEGDTSVETHLSGREHHLSVLRRLLGAGAERNKADLDLDPVERRVIMALYSGVSPFGISEFLGIDVEKIEAIYDRLIELDVIEVERERTEVALTPQGRKVAGEAMGEQ
jgi:helix-turn-helix protein